MAQGQSGYTAPLEVNEAVYQGTFARLSTMTGVPLIGNPEAIAQRLEELTSIVGTIVEALTQTAPVVNTHTVNTAILAARSTNLETQLGELETRFDFVEHQRAQSGNVGGQPFVPKAASEHKAIQSIKILGSDKTGFRLWNQKFTNAVTQIHTGARGFFEALQLKLDTARGVFTDREIYELKVSVENPQNPIDIQRLNEDLYYILVDKCEGEAASRIMSALRGHGVEAYQYIYMWFAGQSGMALSKRMQWIMAPPVPKDDYELSEGLDEYKLQTPFKIAALRILMSNKVDKSDQLKEQAKNSIPQETPLKTSKRLYSHHS